MALSSYVSPLVMAAFDDASMSGSYQVISAAGGIPNNCFLLKIINNSTMDVTISFDGTHDHDYIPTKTAVVYDFQANASPQNIRAWLAAGTKVYGKGTAGTGDIYITGWYQPSLV